MTTRQKLARIAAGYIGAAAVALCLVSARYWLIDPAVANASSGMFAGGDLIFTVLVAGTLGLVPTFFLLRLATDVCPIPLAVFLLALSATAAPSLWAFTSLNSMTPHRAGSANEWLGALLIFVIFPRVVAMPVMVLVLSSAFLLARERSARLILAGSLALEVLPLFAVAVHLTYAALFR